MEAKSKDWVAFQKDYQIAKEAYDKAKEVVQKYEAASRIASMYDGIEMQTSNTTDGTMEMRTEAQRLAFDAVMKPLRETKGIEVVEATDTDVQRVLNNGGIVELSAKQKRALETVSVQKDEHHQTAISSAIGANGNKIKLFYQIRRLVAW